MKLGFLTPYSDERVRFAHAAGFNCLEIRIQPGFELDPIQDAGSLGRARDLLQEQNISVAAVACYFNHLEAGKESERADYFRRIIELAPQLDCGVVATLTGVTTESASSGNPEASLDSFTKIFGEHARVAQDNNVKIAFENWPGAHPFGLIANIAYSPALWGKIFDAVPSNVLGLEYDPSHLARLHMDYLTPIARFADRIHHVHAKDTTIKREVLNEVGYTGQGWWHYSIPSRGIVDWDAFFAALRAINYQGDVNIEHEDPDFQKDNFDEGLHLGQEFLSRYVNGAA